MRRIVGDLVIDRRVIDRNPDHRRDEPGRDLIGQLLYWRAGTARVTHHVHDLRKQRVGPDFVRAHQERTRLVHGAGGHAAAGCFSRRHGLPRNHRFINVRVAIGDEAIDRDLVSGLHTKNVSNLHLIQMDSVNVLQRAHFMPLYSRLGPYPTGLLERAAYKRPRELFEFWGHEASLITVDLLFTASFYALGL